MPPHMTGASMAELGQAPGANKTKVLYAFSVYAMDSNSAGTAFWIAIISLSEAVDRPYALFGRFLESRFPPLRGIRSVEPCV